MALDSGISHVGGCTLYYDLIHEVGGVSTMYHYSPGFEDWRGKGWECRRGGVGGLGIVAYGELGYD